jgi:hypothetical protein
MIVEIPQPITGFISTKSEITSDYAAPLLKAPRTSPRTGITHHLSKLPTGHKWRDPRRGEFGRLADFLIRS